LAGKPLFAVLALKGRPMRLISFLFYYCKVRLGTISGTYRTYHPLDIRWRWQHWQRLERSAGKY
jgi:DNA-directed RNA polymerase specialized sigma24 family protein